MKKLFFLLLVVFGSASLIMGQSDDTNWAGFYAGGHGFVSSDKTEVPATQITVQQITNLVVAGRGIVVVPGTFVNFAQSRRKTGGGGGGQAGYQWQTGNFVFGAEGDFNPFRRTTTLSQNYTIPATLLAPASPVVIQRNVRVDFETSVRGRAGVAFGKSLIYGTGGYSLARVRVANNDSYTNPGGIAPPNCAAPVNSCFNSGPEGPVLTTASSTQNMHGWNVGVGFERKINSKFSVGFDYRHTDLRSKTFTPTNATVTNTGPETVGTNGATGGLGSVTATPTNVSLKNDSFKMRINFHF